MKLLISESQLEIIITHIKETNTSKKEVLEEGWKEVVLGTAMLMGIGLSGANAQTAKNALNNAETIQKIEATLNSPDLDKLVTTLEKAGLKDAMTKIQNNAETVKQNLEAAANKKGVNVNVQVYNTGSKSAVKSKVGQGYAVSDVKVTRDTIWTPKDIIQVANSVELNFDSNIFKTASFDLDESVSSELKETIESILMMGGKITSIQIESSTDTEPIKMGNDKLATLRANSIKSVIDGMGVSTQVDIKTLPEQGPSVYSTSMTPQERESARTETAQYRYVKIIINSVVEPKPQSEETAYKVIEKVKYELTKTTIYGKEKSIKMGNPKKTHTKTFKCKKVKVNKKLTSCEFFN